MTRKESKVADEIMNEAVMIQFDKEEINRLFSKLATSAKFTIA